MDIQLMRDERQLIIDILKERKRISRKKDLEHERKRVSGLLEKIEAESPIDLDEAESLKEILEHCRPDELRRSCGAHEVKREREILARIIDKLNRICAVC